MKLWIFSIFLWLLVSNVMFSQILKDQARQLSDQLQSMVRSELSISNFDYLTRALLEYESNGHVTCVKLRLVTNVENLILDRSSRDSCQAQRHLLLLDGVPSKLELAASSGAKFQLEYFMPSSEYFVWALWGTRAFGLLIISLVFLSFRQRRAAHERILSIEKKFSQRTNEMAAQVAHDIRSPISALQIVAATMSATSSPQRQLIIQATERITNIANDLLNRYRDHSINQKFRGTEDAEPKQAAVEYCDITSVTRSIIQEKRIEYSGHAEKQICFVFDEIDFTRLGNISKPALGRILSNCINNAAEAAPIGESTVWISLKSDIEYHSIIIEDEGEGIQPELVSRINSNLEYLSTKTDGTSKSGYGLGLNFTRKVLAECGGSFEIRSRVPSGVRVCLRMPIVGNRPNVGVGI